MDGTAQQQRLRQFSLDNPYTDRIRLNHCEVADMGEIRVQAKLTNALDDMMARVKYDIYYVENWSLFFDLQILAKTVVICLTGRNAY